MQYQQHPLSAAFPAMGPDDLQALRDSIENIGVQNPITLFQGMVIDGWHRYTVATELGMDCPSAELAADVDPRHFVLAQNKARRHTSAAQMAMAVAAVYDWVPVGNPLFSQSRTECMIADEGQVAQSRTECAIAKTNAELADQAGVSVRTVQQAKAVSRRAIQQVQDAVKRGDIGLPKAAKIAKLPKSRQASALKLGVWEEQKGQPTSHTPEDCGPSAEELAAQAAAEQADRESLQRLLDADDKLAAAHAEITRLNGLSAQLQQRVNGLMSEKAEAIRQVKALQRRIDRLDKEAA